MPLCDNVAFITADCCSWTQRRGARSHTCPYRVWPTVETLVLIVSRSDQWTLQRLP